MVCVNLFCGKLTVGCRLNFSAVWVRSGTRVVVLYPAFRESLRSSRCEGKFSFSPNLHRGSHLPYFSHEKKAPLRVLFFVVDAAGLDSRRELRALVGRCSDAPQARHSFPLPFESPIPRSERRTPGIAGGSSFGGRSGTRTCDLSRVRQPYISILSSIDAVF